MTLPSFADVVAVTGTNSRQIHDWCNEGLVPGQPVNPGSGNHRQWTWGQVELLLVLRQLAKADIVAWSFRLIIDEVVAADWQQPITVWVADYIAVTIDLPAIAAVVANIHRSRL